MSIVNQTLQMNKCEMSERKNFTFTKKLEKYLENQSMILQIKIINLTL